MSTAPSAKLIESVNHSSESSPPPRRHSSAGIGYRWAQELIDYIIDFLHDDKRTLKACSVVSSQWRPVAQYHLFSRIQVSGQAYISAFTKWVRLDGLTHVTSHIQSLSLNGRYPQFQTMGQPVITVRVLTTLLPYLPNLKHLQLFSVYHVSTPAMHEPDPYALRPYSIPPSPQFKLDRLQMTYNGQYVGHRPIHFLFILRLFYEIRTLVIKYPRFEKDGFWTASVASQLDTSLADGIPESLRVETFVCNDGDHGTQLWLEMLQRTASVNTLKHLRILSPNIGNPSSVGILLRDAGPHLLSLALNLFGVSDTAYGRTITDSLELSKCEKLEEIRICLLEQRDRISWATLCNIFSSIAAKERLHTITLEYELLPTNADLWNMMRDALASFSVLRRLVVVDVSIGEVDINRLAKLEDGLREILSPLGDHIDLSLLAKSPA